MISSSVVYGHSTKYSYEILHEYLLLMVISLLAYVAIFSDSFIFGKATSSHFFRVTFFKVTQELLFRSSSFFRTAAFFEDLLFQNCHFFPYFVFIIIFFFFQNSYFCRAKLIPYTERSHLENRKTFGAVTFRNSYLQKISTENLLFRSRFFCTASTFSKSKILGKAFFSEKTIFHMSNFFCRGTFLTLFCKSLPSIAATFSEELLFYNIPFQKSYYFTATLLIN